MPTRRTMFIAAAVMVARVRTHTAIVVHGYHCQARGWDEVVWGDPSAQLLGRIPQAALLAWEARDELSTFICGTGASQAADGKFEADAMVALLFERLPAMQAFDQFRDVDLEALAALLHRTVVTNTESLNTEQEVRFALTRLRRDNVRRAVLVSSPTHVPRCLRDACAIARELGYDGSIRACACDTSWTSDLPVVLEPPHRGDGGDGGGARDDDPPGGAAGADSPHPPPTLYDIVRRASAIAFAARSGGAAGGEEGDGEEGEGTNAAARAAARATRFLAAFDGLVRTFEQEV